MPCLRPLIMWTGNLHDKLSLAGNNGESLWLSNLVSCIYALVPKHYYYLLLFITFSCPQSNKRLGIFIFYIDTDTSMH